MGDHNGNTIILHVDDNQTVLCVGALMIQKLG